MYKAITQSQGHIITQTACRLQSHFRTTAPLIAYVLKRIACTLGHSKAISISANVQYPEGQDLLGYRVVWSVLSSDFTCTYKEGGMVKWSYSWPLLFPAPPQLTTGREVHLCGVSSQRRERKMLSKVPKEVRTTTSDCIFGNGPATCSRADNYDYWVTRSQQEGKHHQTILPPPPAK